MTDEMEFESKMAGLAPEVIDSNERPGEISPFTCPECAGSLYEIRDGQLIRFRCQVGHAYTAEKSMLDHKDEALENALYFALNSLEESAALTERLAAARARGEAL